jgi:hypothetical protein
MFASKIADMDIICHIIMLVLVHKYTTKNIFIELVLIVFSVQL